MTDRRFWSRVTVTEGCWLWDGAVGRSGYGNLTRDGRTLAAHRYAWELTHGAVPDGLAVLHRCDVRACCRPDHLFLGTRAANTADMVAKGRAAVGERNARAKLTEDQVRAIRASSAAHAVTAASFAVSPSLVSMIRSRKVWAHLA